MKQFIILYCSCMVVLGCAQKNNETKKMYDINKYLDTESKSITVDNYVDQLLKGMKRYPEEPMYYLRINKKNCVIEVLVNDVIRLKDYELAFYGNGQIATFKQSSFHKTDKRFRGKSALHFLYKNDGENFRRMKSPYIYLYMPKDKYSGREEDLKLEMIK